MLFQIPQALEQNSKELNMIFLHLQCKKRENYTILFSDAGYWISTKTETRRKTNSNMYNKAQIIKIN